MEQSKRKSIARSNSPERGRKSLIPIVMQKLRRCHKSKTMWWSLIIVILGVVADNLTYFHDTLGDAYYGLILMGIGIITAILRWNTTKPLEDM